MRINDKYLERIYIIFIFGFLCLWSVSTTIASGPDEGMKYDICKYIADTGRLPHGGDPMIRNPIWGISYGFTPILPYMISAVFLKIAMIFTQTPMLLYAAVRFVSVLCMTGMTVMVIKIAHRIFEKRNSRWLFIMITTLLPQVLYLGSYLNNDSFALLTVAMIIYAWICGIQDGWSTRNCILLAVGIGLCALSYYNAYGYILCSIPIYFLSYRKGAHAKEDKKRMWKMAGLITLIAFLIAGWWFIRSALMYNGDFLGLTTSNLYAEQFAQPGFKPSDIPNPRNLSMSLYEMFIPRQWIRTSMMSFVGILRTCDAAILGRLYMILWAVIMAGLAGLLYRWVSGKGKKENGILCAAFIVNILLAAALSVYYSYYNDFQPQGRYMMPMLIPLMVFSVTGWDTLLHKIPNTKVQNGIYAVLYIGLIASSIKCLTVVHGLI